MVTFIDRNDPANYGLPGLNLPQVTSPLQGNITKTVGNMAGGTNFASGSTLSGGVQQGGGAAFGGGFSLGGSQTGAPTQLSGGGASFGGPAPAAGMPAPAPMPAPPQMSAAPTSAAPSTGGMTPMQWARYTGQAAPRPAAPAPLPVGGSASQPYHAPVASPAAYSPPVNPYMGVSAPHTQQPFQGAGPIASGPNGVAFNAAPHGMMQAQPSTAQQMIAAPGMPGITADNGGRQIGMMGGQPPAPGGALPPSMSGQGIVSPAQNPVQQKYVKTPPAKPAQQMVPPPPPEAVSLGALQGMTPYTDPRAIELDQNHQAAALMVEDIRNKSLATATAWIDDYKKAREKLEGAVDKFREEMLKPYGEDLASFSKKLPQLKGQTPMEYAASLDSAAGEALQEYEDTVGGHHADVFKKAAQDMTSDEPMLQKKYVQAVLARDMATAFEGKQQQLAQSYRAEADRIRAQRNSARDAWANMAAKLNEMGEKRLLSLDNAAAKILEAHKFASEAERLVAQTYLSGLTSAEQAKFKEVQLEIQKLGVQIQSGQLGIAAQAQQNTVGVERAKQLQTMIAGERDELKRLENKTEDRHADTERKNAERAKVQQRLDALLKMQE